MSFSLFQGDCLEILPTLPFKVDAVIADPPYGTTYCAWDSVIPLEPCWEQLEQLTGDSDPIVLFASQPFSALLATSRLALFKYEWVWDKQNPANFPNAKKQPLKQHESILVFSKKQAHYYPQKTSGNKNHKQGSSKSNRSESRLITGRSKDDLSGLKYPKSILNFPKHSSQCLYHPTEKPVPLLEYLILTYTKAGDTVLDFCMGSGSTGVACQNLGRHFIGIEKDPAIFKIAQARIEQNEKQRTSPRS